MKRIRACGIVIHDEKLLLLRRKIKEDDYFVFPGGGKEENETLEETVVREVLEETSIHIKVERFIYRLSNENAESNFYVCIYISGEPKLGFGNEVEEAGESNQFEPLWKNVSDIFDLDIRPIEVKNILISQIIKNTHTS